MGDDLRVANVARVSFGKWKEEIDEKDVKLINYLAAHEHNSPFRHVQISVRCKAPVFLARQLVKHCVGLSWNEISRRYVDTGFEFYQPKEWRSRPEGSVKQGSGSTTIQEEKMWVEFDGHYNLFGPDEVVELSLKVYNQMIEAGVAPEMARMILPQSMMVDWVWTGSLEAFYNVHRLRSGEGAQEEAKDFSEQLKQVIEPIFPYCWTALTKE